MRQTTKPTVVEQQHGNTEIELFCDYPEVMSVKQVSSALGICPNSVRALLNQKIIPGKKIGYEWRVVRAELRNWILNQENHA